MKLYTFYNKQFEILKDRFLRTLQDPYEVNCINHEFDPQGAWCGGDEGVLFKTMFLHKVIKENLGDVILFADIDIQFFDKTQDLVINAIKDKDIVFQSHWIPNRTTINIGFMAIRCSDKTFDLWDKTLNLVQTQRMNDQAAVMNLLGIWTENGLGIYPEVILQPQVEINWSLFPRKVWCFNNIEELDNMVPSDIVLHHATFAKTQEEKIAQMDWVREKI